MLWVVSVPGLAFADDAGAPLAEREPCSPFTCSPAQFAREEPCRYIGNFHKESRQILEEMRATKVVTLDEWACMARALQALDKAMTVQCKQKKESLEVVEAWQIERYSPCVESEPKAEILKCSLLSSEGNCALWVDETADAEVSGPVEGVE